MPDITSVLDRAAAPPTRTPDVERPYRAGRRGRVLRGAAAVLIVLAIVVVVAAALPSGSRRVRVQAATLAPTSTIAPVDVSSHDATISVASGWVTSSEPLAWWLHSPFELFSISTTLLPPSPHKAANEAACPSEIPAVAVDNLPADGAYLWVGEWVPGEGLYQPVARPSTFSGVEMNALCPLPRGEHAFGSVYRDGDRDFSVTYVLGPDAPASRRADIDQMLDSLRFH